jgi:adenylate cyclase
MKTKRLSLMRFITNRWIHFILLFVLLLASVYHSGSNARWRKEMQSLVFDQLNQLYPRESSGQVVIVDIDDDSLLKFGQWPWPRTTVAKLVDNLTAAGAKVIAFDGVLAEPDRSSPHFLLESLPAEERFAALVPEIEKLPDHDELLAQAIARSGIFVSGFTYGSYTQQPRPPYLTKAILIKKDDKAEFIAHSERFTKTANFLPNLEQAAAGNGSFMATPDFDGILRRTGMIFNDGNELFPSLSLAAMRVGQNNQKLVTKIGRNPTHGKAAIDTNFRIVVGDYVIPVESDGLFWVYYRIFNEKGGDYVSAEKVLDASATLAEEIKGKYVLIGSSAEGLKDLRSTALEPFQPGVEIHANVIEQILQNKYLLRPDVTVLAEASFILFSGLLMIILAKFIHVLWLGLLCAFGIVGVFIGSATAYVEYGLLLDPFYPSLSVFVIFVVSTLLTYLRVESEKHQVRNAFGLYISPDFMQELTKNPDKLKLGGEIRDLSIMFSDIRSFTTICEGLTPEEIIQLMNDFLTPMSDMVMQNRGTIDKYMGDAMMAFWNAPLDDEFHARHACLTALGMQAALGPVNESVRKKAEAIGKTPVLLNAGIGINTGPCAVGNMGSKQRFAYSTLGDAVNLASRLEGQTKTYGVNILIGESTWNYVPELATLEMDLIKVKGKTKPVRVFALFGDQSLADQGEFKTLKTNHENMIRLYQAGDFNVAQEALKKCQEQKLLDLTTAYKLYKDRLSALIKKPPEGPWDGVYEAKTK